MQEFSSEIQPKKSGFLGDIPTMLETLPTASVKVSSNKSTNMLDTVVSLFRDVFTTKNPEPEEDIPPVSVYCYIKCYTHECLADQCYSPTCPMKISVPLVVTNQDALELDESTEREGSQYPVVESFFSRLWNSSSNGELDNERLKHTPSFAERLGIFAASFSGNDNSVSNISTSNEIPEHSSTYGEFGRKVSTDYVISECSDIEYSAYPLDDDDEVYELEDEFESDNSEVDHLINQYIGVMNPNFDVFEKLEMLSENPLLAKKVSEPLLPVQSKEFAVVDDNQDDNYFEHEDVVIDMVEHALTCAVLELIEEQQEILNAAKSENELLIYHRVQQIAAQAQSMRMFQPTMLSPIKELTEYWKSQSSRGGFSQFSQNSSYYHFSQNYSQFSQRSYFGFSQH
jgi:hypothetical protein